MQISIVTLFPDLYKSFLQTSLLKHAVAKGSVKFNLINLLQLAEPGCRVDEPTVGPGPGMILKPEIVAKGIYEAKKIAGDGLIVFFSPKGVLLDQIVLQQVVTRLDPNLMTESSSPETPCQANGEANDVLLKKQHLIMVCARYEGIDARVEAQLADLQISIGDYVLMGGDLPAQVFLEGLLRLLPAVVGNEQSVLNDSFQGPLLDHAEYGLPVEWQGAKIPEVLLSGHHGKIAQYRHEQAMQETLLKSFD